MYYTPETIRGFLAGMASSHFIILEGLSGTGKTSLPKYFAEFFGANVCFTSVQASSTSDRALSAHGNTLSISRLSEEAGLLPCGSGTRTIPDIPCP